jgi:SAM-dependent methyltransferase
MISILRLLKKNITRAEVAVLRHFYTIKPLRRLFWEVYADEIHTCWGLEKQDFMIVSNIISTLEPRSILDIGCGSGRLFSLYLEKDIVDITGVDISHVALSIAKKEYPQVTTICSSLEDSDFGEQFFDLAISNRTLQHVPPALIDLVVKKICLHSRYVYINESVLGEEGKSGSLFQHDYEFLFQSCHFVIIDTGFIGNQRYYLFLASG